MSTTTASRRTVFRGLSSPRRSGAPAFFAPTASELVADDDSTSRGGQPCSFAASQEPVSVTGLDQRASEPTHQTRPRRGPRTTAIAQQHDHGLHDGLEVGASHDAAILRPSGCCSISAPVRAPFPGARRYSHGVFLLQGSSPCDRLVVWRSRTPSPVPARPRSPSWHYGQISVQTDGYRPTAFRAVRPHVQTLDFRRGPTLMEFLTFLACPP